MLKTYLREYFGPAVVAISATPRAFADMWKAFSASARDLRIRHWFALAGIAAMFTMLLAYLGGAF